MSSHVSSWTYPTWLASMKQGLHIMLQRFVRSTVRTAPRPWRIDEEPWSCRVSFAIFTSRPKKFSSSRVKKAASVEIRSSYVPCFGHVLTIQISFPRWTMSAGISPGRPSISSRSSRVPFRMASRTSFVQAGQRESVLRGNPRGGFDRSKLFGSGSGDHAGWKERAGIRRFTH